MNASIYIEGDNFTLEMTERGFLAGLLAKIGCQIEHIVDERYIPNEGITIPMQENGKTVAVVTLKR